MGSVRIDDDLYKKIRGSAYKNGRSISTQTEIILSEFFTKNIDSDSKEVSKSEDISLSSDLETKKILLSLNLTLYNSIKTLADKNYSSVTKYINVALENHVKKYKYRLTDRELEILNEYNYELCAIGRNLNQIAKKLNQNKYSSVSEVTIKLLQNISDTIENYNEAIKAVIFKN